ncbi:hypothetical protein Q9L58_002044 [Maublancomyces gigas]|uniref:Uncharacterized protein n=1 Tax=Discina gigas TaxID=1032678 RepID=A0ABR3GSN0_9PEZI
MKSSIISSIAVLASFVVATPILSARDDPKVFKLVAGPDAPAEIAGHPVQIISASLGWSTDSTITKDGTFFIQNNAKSGVTFYSKDTAYEIFLRPTHGTPLYFVRLGNPALDAAPPLTISTFTVSDTTGSGTETFSGGFLACGQAGNYNLMK